MTADTRLNADEITALKGLFRTQTEELLEQYGREVLELERGSRPEESLKSLRRVVHTVKGDSMSLEFDRLAELAHRLEDLLDALNKSGGAVTRQQIDLLLTCGDAMAALLRGYCAEPPEVTVDIAPLCGQLEEILERPTPSSQDQAQAVCYRVSVTFTRTCQMHSAGAFLIRQRLEPMSRVVETVPDPESPEIERSRVWKLVVVTAASLDELRRAARVPGVSSRVDIEPYVVPEVDLLSTNGLASSSSADTAAETALSPVGSSSEHLRMEVAKIDRIMNLVGELVIGRSMVSQALTEISASDEVAVARLGAANHFLERTLTELQAVVLKIRMVPVDHVFRRFPRLVRDLALGSGKEVRLDIQGAATELDKSIVDALHEPLLHLVRNAIDHGLERPEERARSGKPSVGRLKLAALYEGNHVHILIEDDGRGIDLSAVRRRAVELGLATPEEIVAFGPDQTLSFLYHPGFSTRDEVSTVSGRGIGMDVVRKTIEELKGTVELTTEEGRGTRFLIRLPLTLAILRAILVESAGIPFAVPLAGVLEIVRVFRNEADTVLGESVIRLRDEVVPLVDLKDALDLGLETGENAGRAFVVLAGTAERKVGLLVDRLLGEHELVVKPIEDPLVQSPGIAGASILGDGKVVLILDVRELTRRRRLASAPEEIRQ